MAIVQNKGNPYEPTDRHWHGDAPYVHGGGGSGAPPIDTVPETGFGVVADGVADDTLSLQEWLEYGMSSGEVLSLHGPARVTTGFTLTGTGANCNLRVIGYGDAKFLADGANKITLAGTFGTITFEGVSFENFTHSPFWLADDVTINGFHFHNCDSVNNLIFLSVQGNPAQIGTGAAALVLTYVPNAGITIRHLCVTHSRISGGRGGIILPVVVEAAHIEANTVSGLANSTATGSTLEHSVTGFQIGPLGGNLTGLDFIGSAGGPSPDLLRIKSTTVVNNKLNGLTQNVATKGCMGIGVNGFNCVVSGNQLLNVTSPGGRDSADADNNDNEGIYVKAACATITGNTFRNCASTEALINLKGSSLGRTNYAGGGENPGYGNVISGNTAYWDIAPPQGINFCAVYGAPCVITGNSAIGIGGALGSAPVSVINVAFDIQGEFGEAGVNQSPVIIDNNYMRGPFDFFVRHRGGIDGLRIGPGNIADIVGGDGACGYYFMSQGTFGTEVRNVNIAGVFRVRNRANSVLANLHAVFSAGDMPMPVRAFVVDGLVIDTDHVSNTNIQYRLLNFSAGSGPSFCFYKGMVFRNIIFPKNLSGNQIAEFPNDEFEYDFDCSLEYTTTAASGTFNLWNVRVAINHCAMTNIYANAFDPITGDHAMYHQEGSWRRIASASLAGLANTIGTPIEQTDAVWSIASTVSTFFFLFQILGDATNPTQWKVHIRVTQIGGLA